MAKLTKDELKTVAQATVIADKQAGEWDGDVNSFNGLLLKIAKIVSIEGAYEAILNFLDGEEFTTGEAIEEYLTDLILPVEDDGSGDDDNSPSYPTFEEPGYSSTLPKHKIKTTIASDRIETSCRNEEDAAQMVARIMSKLYASETLYENSLKKQLLGNFIDKAIEAGLVETVAKPVDAETGATFIKKVKEEVEKATKFEGEGRSLTDTLIGKSPELVLVVKSGILPSLDVDTLAGAFHLDKLSLPAKIEVVDDFGVLTEGNEGAYAILLDPRGAKLCPNYKAVRTKENADGDFINYVLHTRFTAFISKFTYVKVFKDVAGE